MAPRKTQRQKSLEQSAENRDQWEWFRDSLQKITTPEEAKRLVREAPPHPSPGRKLYSNLAFFLQDYSIPMGADHAEKRLYVDLIQRFAEAGELKPKEAADVIERLEQDLKMPDRR